MTSKLVLKRRMFLYDAHHFRAGVLHLDLTRNQAHQRAANQHQAADPDPRYQRQDVRLDHRALVVVRHAAEVQVQVFVERGRTPTSEVPCLLAL